MVGPAAKPLWQLRGDAPWVGFHAVLGGGHCGDTPINGDTAMMRPGDGDVPWVAHQMDDRAGCRRGDQINPGRRASLIVDLDQNRAFGVAGRCRGPKPWSKTLDFMGKHVGKLDIRVLLEPCPRGGDKANVVALVEVRETA